MEETKNLEWKGRLKKVLESKEDEINQAIL
jgi:hypothetical protein